MKKTILVTSLLISINLFGADKLTCESIFKDAIHNFYLENSCSFDKHLSSNIRKKFKQEDCEKLFSEDEMKQLNSEVLGSSYQKMNKIGKDTFCKNNKNIYDEQSKKYTLSK